MKKASKLRDTYLPIEESLTFYQFIPVAEKISLCWL